MKKLFIFVLFLLGIVCGFSQSNATYNKIKYYFGDSINSSANIKSVVQFDSNYYMAVDAYADSILYKVFIIKTDLEGNMIKSIDFGSDTIAYHAIEGNGLIIDSDSNIVVVGSYIYGEWGGFAIKLDRNLDTIWHRRYIFPDSLLTYPHSNPSHSFKSIKETLDGQYVITGLYFIDSLHYDQYSRSFLMILDTSGSVNLIKAYTNLSHIYDMAVLPDSAFALTEFPASSNSWTIVKVDKHGSVVWRTSIGNNNIRSGNISLSSDGSIIAMSQFIRGQTPTLTLLGAHVIKVNHQTGQVVWSKKYATYATLTCLFNPNFELEVLSNNDIIIAGTARVMNHDSTTGGLNGIMFKLNSNGDSLWCRYYIQRLFKDNCQFNDMIITDDGGFLAVGFHHPLNFSNYYGAWLVKMDSLGYAPGGHTVDIQDVKPNQAFQVQVFPNPAEDVINFVFKRNIEQKTTLTIYNSVGQKVITSLVHKNQLAIEVSLIGLETGVYYYELRNKDKNTTNGKFIKVR